MLAIQVCKTPFIPVFSKTKMAISKSTTIALEEYVYGLYGAIILRTGKCYFDVYFQSCEVTRDTNIKITLELLHKQFPMTLFTSLYITREKISQQMTTKRRSANIDPMSHSNYLSCDDDIPIECALQYPSRLLIRKHVEMDISLLRIYLRQYARQTLLALFSSFSLNMKLYMFLDVYE